METQEKSVDPILQTLSQSNSLDLAEVVKQKDPNVSNPLIQMTRILISLRLQQRSWFCGPVARWTQKGGSREQHIFSIGRALQR